MVLNKFLFAMQRKLHFAQLLGTILLVYSCSGDKPIRYEDFPRIDAHVHIRTANQEILPFAIEEDFKFIMLCTTSGSRENIDRQLNFAKIQRKRFPQDFSYLTTFSMEKFEDQGWQEEVIRLLEKDFEEGAIGVKVWKDIGMTFRDSLGNFIMIDDPRFDPILQYIADHNKTLVAHIGEPRNCWLPLDSMTVNSDRNYYRNHPEYHMYTHPDYPSYEAQIEARDNMLANHPKLRVVGAHLGSLEWSVDELARRLEKYPNFAVDMAARVCHFQVQETAEVRNFIMKYQNRLMYATDFGIRDDSDFEGLVSELSQEWKDDWKYFSTEEKMSNHKIPHDYMGLGFDKEILRKIYYDNVFQWFPEVFK